MSTINVKCDVVIARFVVHVSFIGSHKCPELTDVKALVRNLFNV